LPSYRGADAALATELAKAGIAAFFPADPPIPARPYGFMTLR